MISVTEAAEKLKVSRRRILALCAQGRIVGAAKIGNYWAIPNPPIVMAANRKRHSIIKMQ